MDFLVFALWGIFTGAIVMGSFSGKKSDVALINPDAQLQTIVTNPVPEQLKQSEDRAIVSEPYSNSASAASNINPLSETTLSDMFQPENSNPSILAESLVDPYTDELPLGLKIDQLMVDSNGHPLTYTVKRGEFLTQIAQQNYGDARFWPYILEVNRHLFNSPEGLQADMKLFLPSTTLYDINAEDEKSINKVKALLSKYVQ